MRRCAKSQGLAQQRTTFPKARSLSAFFCASTSISGRRGRPELVLGPSEDRGLGEGDRDVHGARDAVNAVLQGSSL
jgi:hypothetical protein